MKPACFLGAIFTKQLGGPDESIPVQTAVTVLCELAASGAARERVRVDLGAYLMLVNSPAFRESRESELPL